MRRRPTLDYCTPLAAPPQPADDASARQQMDRLGLLLGLCSLALALLSLTRDFSIATCLLIVVVPVTALGGCLASAVALYKRPTLLALIGLMVSLSGLFTFKLMWQRFTAGSLI